MHEIAKTVNISSKRVHDILLQLLNTKNLLAKWVPLLLTVNQKKDLVTCSEDDRLFQRNPSVVVSSMEQHTWDQRIIEPMRHQRKICIKERGDRSSSLESYSGYFFRACQGIFFVDVHCPPHENFFCITITDRPNPL